MTRESKISLNLMAVTWDGQDTATELKYLEGTDEIIFYKCDVGYVLNSTTKMCEQKPLPSNIISSIVAGYATHDDEIDYGITIPPNCEEMPVGWTITNGVLVNFSTGNGFFCNVNKGQRQSELNALYEGIASEYDSQKASFELQAEAGFTYTIQYTEYLDEPASLGADATLTYTGYE